MRDLLLDTSMVLKWFRREGECEVEQAEWHLQAHRTGVVNAHLLDLGLYELGNVLVRALNRTAEQTSSVLEAARMLCGPPLTLDAAGFSRTAELACQHDLTFYDAAFAVAAKSHECTLISADGKLLDSGLAITLTQSMARLRGS